MFVSESPWWEKLSPLKVWCVIINFNLLDLCDLKALLWLLPSRKFQVLHCSNAFAFSKQYVIGHVSICNENSLLQVSAQLIELSFKRIIYFPIVALGGNVGARRAPGSKVSQHNNWIIYSAAAFGSPTLARVSSNVTCFLIWTSPLFYSRGSKWLAFISTVCSKRNKYGTENWLHFSTFQSLDCSVLVTWSLVLRSMYCKSRDST